MREKWLLVYSIAKKKTITDTNPMYGYDLSTANKMIILIRNRSHGFHVLHIYGKYTRIFIHSIEKMGHLFDFFSVSSSFCPESAMIDI